MVIFLSSKAFKGIKKGVIRKLIMTLELVCQCLCFYSFYLFHHQPANAIAIMCIVILLRTLRVLPLLEQINTFKLIFKAVRMLALPFYILLLSLYTLNFTFAVVGMIWFGGKLQRDSAQSEDPEIPPLYYLINYNDFGSALISMFTLIMTGNWGLVVKMYEIVMETKLVRIYFVSFYILAVLIMINIVVAFALEMYESVKSRIEDQVAKENALKHIKQENLDNQQFNGSYFYQPIIIENQVSMVEGRHSLKKSYSQNINYTRSFELPPQQRQQSSNELSAPKLQSNLHELVELQEEAKSESSPDQRMQVQDRQ